MLYVTLLCALLKDDTVFWEMLEKLRDALSLLSTDLRNILLNSLTSTVLDMRFCSEFVLISVDDGRLRLQCNLSTFFRLVTGRSHKTTATYMFGKFKSSLWNEWDLTKFARKGHYYVYYTWEDNEVDVLLRLEIFHFIATHYPVNHCCAC